MYFCGKAGPYPEGLSTGGTHHPRFFFLKRTSEPCERENFARKEIVFMLSDAFLEIILHNNTC